MTSPRAFVFDLDGTLIDSMPLVVRAYQHALAPYHSPLSEAELLQRMGGPPERIFAQLLQDSTHISGALQRLETYAADAWKLIQPFPGVREMLDALAAARCQLALWTGRERASAEWLLREHEFASRIRVTLCGDDLPTHKPDPAGLAELLRRLQAQPADAVFVGDAGVDVQAGAALGVRTVYITHGAETEPSLRAAAWRVVDTPAEAYGLLRSLLPPDTTVAAKSVP